MDNMLLPQLIGQNPNVLQSLLDQSTQLGPYQEGVKKALKESGYAHAQEAVQAGIPPQHIEQQSGLRDAGMQMIQSLLGNLTNPGGGNQPPNNQPPTPPKKNETQGSNTDSTPNPNPQPTSDGSNPQGIGGVNYVPASSPFGFGDARLGPNNQVTIQNPGMIGALLQGLFTGNTRAGVAQKEQELSGALPIVSGSQELQGQQPAQAGQIELAKAGAGFAMPMQTTGMTSQLADSYNSLRQNMGWMQGFLHNIAGYETPAMQSVRNAMQVLSGAVPQLTRSKAQAVSQNVKNISSNITQQQALAELKRRGVK